jgi:hypothetical protein
VVAVGGQFRYRRLPPDRKHVERQGASELVKELEVANGRHCEERSDEAIHGSAATLFPDQ